MCIDVLDLSIVPLYAEKEALNSFSLIIKKATKYKNTIKAQKRI